MTEEEKYEVLEKIGHGSFGIIRKVRRKVDGHILCRKEISYIRMSTKEREQLQAELSILKELRHPNIVAYYEREHLKASQDLHLYMEYCGNGDLGRVIQNLKQKNQYADEEFVWSVFSQLITALYRCHYGQDPPEVSSNVMGLGNNAKPLKSKQAQYMILHRDLKPENVFLGADNSVKLGDFGLSKILSSHDFASTYVGTPFYMSPEICAAEKYTLQSDVWSLGCIMYELCAKEPPFNAKTHFDLVQKIKVGRVNPLPSVYSPELRKVVESCLRVNPTTRPDTAQLLNLPIIKLMRKEQEVVKLGQQMKAEKELASQKLKEAADRVTMLEKEKDTMRDEVESVVRREWEVKARLEIDRLVQLEYERLQKHFDEEVKKRLDEELSKRSPIDTTSINQQTTLSRPPTSAFIKSSTPTRDTASVTSRTTAGSTTDFPSGTDLSSLSLDSPTELKPHITAATATNNLGKDISKAKPIKRPTRTPFTRAKTMAVGAASPMDVQMADPSPASIAGLSLSPRKNGAEPKARGIARKNIFAVAAGEKWIPEMIDSYPSFSSDDEDSNDKAGGIDGDIDDDDGDVDECDALQSPTVAKKPSRLALAMRAKDGPATRTASGQGTAATTTVRKRQSLAPRGTLFPNSRLNSAPTALYPTLGNTPSAATTTKATSNLSSAAIKSRPQSTVPVVATSPVRRTQARGTRGETGSPVKKTSNSNFGNGNKVPHSTIRSKKAGSGATGSSSSSSEEMLKAATKNNLHGRTLVELSQARTVNAPGYQSAGSDRSAVTSGTLGSAGTSTDRDGDKKKIGSGTEASKITSKAGYREPEVVWDPEKDEMPSPFLVRGRAVVERV